MAIDFSRLDEHERRGYVVLDAIAPDGRPSASTHSRPTAFLCVDGKVYWTKATAQQGLVAELVAGRLAARLSAGPLARIVRIPQELVQSQADQVGVVVGSVDEPDTVNARELGAAGLTLPATGINASARGRVVAFQTWLGVSDAQVLIRLTDGAVLSIDHGDAFGNLVHNDPTPIVTDIPGVSADLGRRGGHVMPAVAAIEGLSDRDLIDSVGGVPAGAVWRSEQTRRREIVEFLAFRRGRIREVMVAWSQT